MVTDSKNDKNSDANIKRRQFKIGGVCRTQIILVRLIIAKRTLSTIVNDFDWRVSKRDLYNISLHYLGVYLILQLLRGRTVIIRVKKKTCRFVWNVIGIHVQDPTECGDNRIPFLERVYNRTYLSRRCWRAYLNNSKPN